MGRKGSGMSDAEFYDISNAWLAPVLQAQGLTQGCGCTQLRGRSHPGVWHVVSPSDAGASLHVNVSVLRTLEDSYLGGEFTVEVGPLENVRNLVELLTAEERGQIDRRQADMVTHLGCPAYLKETVLRNHIDPDGHMGELGLIFVDDTTLTSWLQWLAPRIGSLIDRHRAMPPVEEWRIAGARLPCDIDPP